MNYKSFNLGDWIGHISGVIEDESELDGNEMRDLVEFLSRLPRWIPCSERLPEEDGQYLISTCMNCIDTCLFYKDDDEYLWVDYEESVIAWMPLPKPYKAESEVRNGKKEM